MPGLTKELLKYGEHIPKTARQARIARGTVARAEAPHCTTTQPTVVSGSLVHPGSRAEAGACGPCWCWWPLPPSRWLMQALTAEHRRTTPTTICLTSQRAICRQINSWRGTFVTQLSVIETGAHSRVSLARWCYTYLPEGLVSAAVAAEVNHLLDLA